MQLRKILFISILFFSVKISAGTLKGRVTYNGSNPLAGVAIAIENSTIGTTTNFDGTYIIRDLDSGSHTVVFSYLGFEKKTIRVTLADDETLEFNVEMLESVTHLDETIVLGKSEATRIQESAQAVTVLKTSVAKVQTADLGEVLSRVEGVSVQRTGGLGSATRFSLNGLSGDQVRFFLDGIPLNFMGYNAGIASVPVNLINRVEIFKGVVPIRFGADALGGAVNLVTPIGTIGTNLDISYQTGSFGTHRAAMNFAYYPKISGFFSQLSAFYDFARNNYKVQVEIPDELGRPSEETISRFHDSYLGMGINTNLGWRGLLWADKIAINIFANSYRQDIQNNNVMTIPYGEPTSGVTSYGGHVNWRKDFEPKFSIHFVPGYSRTQTDFKDDGIYFYNWFGERITASDSNDPLVRMEPGEIGQASDRYLWDDNYYMRLSLDYEFFRGHYISLASSPTFVSRTGKERLLINPDSRDPLSAQRDVFTFINGVEYQWKSLNGRWENIVFFKDYIQNVQAEEPLIGNRLRNRNRYSHEIGLGNGLRTKIGDNFSLKLSYEWATRMPRPTEMFGNGILIASNLELRPERSHNGNLELNYSPGNDNDSQLDFGVNFFIRKAEEQIVLLGNDLEFRYQNVFEALSQGFELALKWGSKKNRLFIETNSTWQDFRNTSDEGVFGDFKGDRIPNRPYFFVNGSARYRFPEVLGSSNELEIFTMARYIHEFFRSWESAGIREYKQTIPTQNLLNVGFTYKINMESFTATVSGEIQNITDQKAFDFFGVQRPGRAIFTKLTIDI